MLRDLGPQWNTLTDIHSEVDRAETDSSSPEVVGSWLVVVDSRLESVDSHHEVVSYH